MSLLQSTLIGGFLDFAGPVTLLALLLWLYSLWGLLGPLPQRILESWKYWVIALLGAGVVFLSTKIDFKVLSDETNLLSVANMLTVMGRASNTEQWVSYYHNFHALDVSVPSRPILFPVLTSLVQHVVGLAWWSPFAVNFLFLTLLFGLVLIWVSRFERGLAAPRTITLLALLMSPVLAISATSAGYDLCSTTIGFACFLLLLVYESRRDSQSLECLAYGLICFASVRYESIVALPLTAAGLILLEGPAVVKKLPLHAYVLCFVLVLPLLVQRFLTWGSFENPEGVAPFSVGHVWHHLPIFLRSFFLEANGPYPILLHWLGVGGLLVVLRRLKGVRAIPFVYCVFLLLLLLSHHFGRADHPTQARLFLTVSFALSLLALEFVRAYSRSLDQGALLIVFGLLCYHHHEYAVHDPLSAQLTMTREVRFIRDFLGEDGRKDDLWVYDRPGQLSALGSSAISWKTFNERQGEFLGNLRNALYNRVLLIERVPYDPKKAAEAFGLVRSGYRLKSLREHQLSPEERLRIAVVELAN